MTGISGGISGRVAVLASLSLMVAASPAWAEEAAADAGVGEASEVERLRGEVEELKARMDASEEAALAQAGGSQFEPTFDVYGFLTVDTQKWFLPEGSAAAGIVDPTWSFSIDTLNLYFSSHMSETLSALVEIGLTTLPHGTDKSLAPYERYDQRVTDPRTSETETIGGIIIERAQVVWQPYDFFGVTAGRYLTPFGIWNIDHSPLLLLTKDSPYLMLRQTIPLAQTGVAVQGRFFPASHTYFDYAITLSNGRGPTEETFDVDDNKAVGLRLKGLYEKDDFSVSLGAYGFYGKASDTVKELEIEPEFDIVVNTTEEYRELSGAADFQLKLWGLLLQAEWAGGLIRYSERPQKMYPIIGLDIPGELYQPDFLRWDVYGLVAWTLPLERWLRDKQITLYALGDYSVMDDTDPNYDTMFWRWGIDFRPISFVVIKADFALLWLPDSELIRGKAYAAGLEVAVGF